MATTAAIFRKTKDAGEPLDITQELTASDLIRYTVPAGGPFVTGAPQSNTLVEGTEVLLSPLATIAADSLANPMTVADVLLFTEVSEGGADDANRQMLPLGVGVVVPHFATTVPDDGWLPVSGGTFNDVDHPELAAAIAAGNTVGTDLADGTFRLLDLNSALTDGRGRVLEGLGTQTPGELQNDATAVNGLRVNRTYVQADWNGLQNTDVSKGSNSNPGRVIDGQVLSSSQSQTRAPAISVLWMVRAKPWTHAGDVTINQGGVNIYANVVDQAIPDANIHTYAVDLPDLEVGDKITVVIARGTRLFECTGRFLFFGQVYESVFTPGQSAWTVEVVGTQLRIQSFGDGAQAVKAIFVER